VYFDQVISGLGFVFDIFDVAFRDRMDLSDVEFIAFYVI
jgi:hypothetical protein